MPEEAQRGDAEDAEAYEMPENPKRCATCNLDKTYVFTVFRCSTGIVILSKRSLMKEKERPMAA